MRVFLQEWKKIWRPGILVALLVLGLAYFYLFSNFLHRVLLQWPHGPGRV